MKKIILLALLLGIIVLSGCSNLYEPKTREPEEPAEVTEEVEEPAKQINELAREKSERIAQVDELLIKLDEQFDSDRDLIRSTYESSADNLRADCEQETGYIMEVCFDKIGMLIEIASLIEKNHITLWTSLKKDLINYGFNSQVDLQDIYQNALNDLARDTEEGIQKIKESSSFKKTSDDMYDDMMYDDMYDDMRRDDMYRDMMYEDMYKCEFEPEYNYITDTVEMVLKCPTLPSASDPVPQKQPSVAECISNIYNCSDFPTQLHAQAMLNMCPTDVHKLDRDGDGIACETLP